jgi:hypothetical protein
MPVGFAIKFKIAACSSIACGDYSDENSSGIVFMPAKVYATPPVPTLTLVGLSIQVNWEAQSAAVMEVDEYRIQFLKSDSTFVESSDCAGNNVLVVSSR